MMFKFDAHDGDVNAVRWSPSGRYFATAGNDRKIKIWDASGGYGAECRSVLTGSNGAIMSLDLDNGGYLVLGAGSDFATRIWTLEESGQAARSQLRHTLTGHSDKVMTAKFIGDTNKVATGSYDRTLKVWDLISRSCVSTLRALSWCNDLVAFDGNIVSGHSDKKVRVWELRSPAEPTAEIQGRVSK